LNRADLDFRVLFLAPTRRDGVVARQVLEKAGITVQSCASPEELIGEVEAGAGAILLPEEAVRQGESERLVGWLSRQPAWSDLPVLVLARPGADSATVATAMDRMGNLTVLERPLRVSSLVSAIRTALRSRRRQYETREHLLRIESDVTDRKRAEEALKEADRRKDEFLAILAHELRNPLAPIRNSLHILRLAAGNHPNTERVSELMERQVNHMVRLVDDLFEVSRITRGKIELRKERVQVAVVLRGAVETSRSLIEASHHQLRLDLPAQPLTIDGDPVRLTQVFANLLNNAAKYTPDGGRIDLEVEDEGEHVAVSIRDTGAGIPAEMLPRVFDPFIQGNRSNGKSPGGLGIGLTLVKMLVEMHGGAVEAHSDGPGQGSEFVVRLPLLHQIVAPHREPVPSTAGSFPPLRILVVDDNQDSAASLGMLLRLLGADTHVVYSGADALRVVATYQPDAVLVDIGMPDMDGHEVARRLRESPKGRNMMLIALTGWGQEQDRLRSQLAGFDHHLIKPADVGALEALLDSFAHPRARHARSSLGRAHAPGREAASR
jgi:signal transduction histidine kinase/ActR/RegA family two-component response regulator